MALAEVLQLGLVLDALQAKIGSAPATVLRAVRASYKAVVGGLLVHQEHLVGGQGVAASMNSS